MPSDRFPGRAKVTFGWLNSVPISQAAIAISGVYGEKLDSDQNTVLIQPDANPGDCYHWYSKQKSPANQGDVTKIVVEGLWPDHEYCFYAVYQPNTVPPDATELGADQGNYRTDGHDQAIFAALRLPGRIRGSCPLIHQRKMPCGGAQGGVE